MEIKTVFFDLDRTLWDFEKNSEEALLELLHKHKLVTGNETEFIEEYRAINDKYWKLYRDNKVTKYDLRVNRFYEVLKLFSIDDRYLAKAFGDDYIALCPTKTNLVPNALEVVEYLANKYPLHIITNGFDKTQQVKLKGSGLDVYFKTLTTSENAKSRKPMAKIYTKALQRAKAQPETSIMIGDDFIADVLGAKKMGLHQVFFNVDNHTHTETITHEITELTALQDIL